MRFEALAKKARFYADEVRFANASVPDVRQRRALLRHTLAFHWNNARKSPPVAGEPLSLALALKTAHTAAYHANVTIRPTTGDLAILYEVLGREAYALDPGLFDATAPLVIIDAGANIGLSAIYFASRFPNARIFAIEPNPANFALLKANTAREPRIEAIQACVTPLPKQRVFIETSGPAWGFKTNTAQRGVEVRGLSIAELMEDHALAGVDLLKIDIEGAEREVFAEGAFLAHVEAIVAELHGGYDLNAFRRDLTASGHTARVSPYADDPQVVIASRELKNPGHRDRGS